VSLLIAALIKAIVGLLNVAGRQTAAAAPAARPVAAPPQPHATAAADIPAEHVAAIAAAVCATVGAHRIVHIEDLHGGRAWGAEGRSAHHQSHVVPGRPRKR
jgi:hypothetical protein